VEKIQYVRGSFAGYRANQAVFIGANGKRSEVKIDEGEMVEYDGQSLRYGGDEIAVPELRSAIERGWFEADTRRAAKVAKPAAKSSSVSSKPVKKSGYQTVEDQQEVGDVSRSMAKRKAVTSKAEAPKVRPAPAQKKFALASDDFGEGVEVGRLAKSSAAVGDPDVGAKGTFNPMARGKPVGEEPPKVIRNKTAKTVKEGHARIIESEVPEVLLEEGHPTVATVRGQRAKSQRNDPDRISAVIEGWDKGQHWQMRLKEAVDSWGHDKSVLKAICDIETPGVVRGIKAHLAKKP
jgi:hypothetical protein